MRKRVAYIQFPTKFGNSPALFATQKALDGLNIKFQIEVFSSAGLPSSSHIEVFNLNQADLEFLSSGSATWAHKQVLFQLYAGYEGQVSLLYSGQIMEAYPQGNPDISFKISGLADVRWSGHNFSFEATKVKIMTLIRRAANEMNYNVRIDKKIEQNNPALNKVLPKFSYTGSPMGLLQKAQEAMGKVSAGLDTVFITISNGEVTVWTPKSERSNQILLVSKDTGMIGLPRPTGAGCDVTILLDTTIRCGDKIKIQTTRIPMLNGEYYVTGLTHDGEIRATSWYTTLKCARASNYEKAQDGK